MSRVLIEDTGFLIFVEEYCKKILHVYVVLQSALGKEGTGMGTGSVMCGKGALDKINTEGTGRSWR